ncbi:Glutaredoxin-like protein [Venustampulla echinocandica]|uniref:Glutaredoxin-like protein n=1 Tax=Venustampulla echinocandica TaxID=2656787 RepID=A0A370U2G8_9HELO|nr:Glutaredoxin-like protein [Venustampulla echinocandica]RDL41976.1 Glutaredoxin-like protein [Venustampulla echinocandica]
MRPSSRLLQHACRITLFTRENCSLCTNAKSTLSAVWDKRPFDYKEINVMKPGANGWKDLYEFDTPVIHVSSSKTPDERPELSSKAQKLMHRFTAEQVTEKMDAVEPRAN